MWRLTTKLSKTSSKKLMLTGRSLSDEQRTIGFPDYAPAIPYTADNTNQTRDIGTIALDSNRFEHSFRGNLADLGAWFLISLMYVYLVLTKMTSRKPVAVTRA